MAETWAAMTIRAARALGLHDRGAITKGTRADLVFYPASDYREILYHQGQMKPLPPTLQGLADGYTLYDAFSRGIFNTLRTRASSWHR